MPTFIRPADIDVAWLHYGSDLLDPGTATLDPAPGEVLIALIPIESTHWGDYGGSFSTKVYNKSIVAQFPCVDAGTDGPIVRIGNGDWGGMSSGEQLYLRLPITVSQRVRAERMSDRDAIVALTEWIDRGAAVGMGTTLGDWLESDHLASLRHALSLFDEDAFCSWYDGDLEWEMKLAHAHEAWDSWARSDAARTAYDLLPDGADDAFDAEWDDTVALPFAELGWLWTEDDGTETLLFAEGYDCGVSFHIDVDKVGALIAAFWTDHGYLPWQDRPASLAGRHEPDPAQLTLIGDLA